MVGERDLSGFGPSVTKMATLGPTDDQITLLEWPISSETNGCDDLEAPYYELCNISRENISTQVPDVIFRIRISAYNIPISNIQDKSSRHTEYRSLSNSSTSPSIAEEGTPFSLIKQLGHDTTSKIYDNTPESDHRGGVDEERSLRNPETKFFMRILETPTNVPSRLKCTPHGMLSNGENHILRIASSKTVIRLLVGLIATPLHTRAVMGHQE